MSGMPRPYFRSMLANTLYDHILKEERLKKIDPSQWYHCDLDQVTTQLRDLYIPFNCDNDTNAFLEICYMKADWFFVQVFHSLAKTFLCWFMTQTSINGFLGRGSTFVFSQSQFQQLLGVSSEWHAHSLLDLGAGDGNVTAIMAPYFDVVHVTEMSSVMQRILAGKGYHLLEVDKWTDGDFQYDMISCLNLLDRCDKPITMLNQIKSKLKPVTGRLIVALVLPLSQYVEMGKPNHQPSEQLHIEGKTIEEQVVSCNHSVFEPAGYEIIRWTVLPYLCEGDIEQSFYWLTDIVFVLKVKFPNHEPIERNNDFCIKL